VANDSQCVVAGLKAPGCFSFLPTFKHEKKAITLKMSVRVLTHLLARRIVDAWDSQELASIVRHDTAGWESGRRARDLLSLDEGCWPARSMH
jgi:hypothetical protein